MSHARDRFTPLDPGRIDWQSQDELRYWEHEFRCTKARLLDALERVGDHVAAVREYLGAHPHGGKIDGPDRRLP